MKILLTADPELPVPPVYYGGIERIIDGMIRNYRKQGHQVGLVAHRDSSVALDVLYAWPGARSQHSVDLVKNSFALRKAYRDFRPDIVHSFSRLAYLIPIIRTLTPKIMSYQREPGTRQIIWANRLSRSNLAFTGCSDYIISQGKKAGGKWKAIHNFVELDRYSCIKKISSDAPLVFLSRIEEIKGCHWAIEIAKRSGKKLIIAGNRVNSDEGLDYWENKIKPHLDGENIQYIGEVQDHEKNELLGKACAMLVPIQWNEPFGIVFAEALACGTPVISCPKGALPEIIQNGKNGFLIDSIEEGVKAVHQIKKLSRFDCRKSCETFFSADVICKKYLNLYQSLF